MKKWSLVVLIIGFCALNQLWGNSFSLLKKGDPIPSFVLHDQNGTTLRHSDFNGKIVVINFIFTRCGAPTMCPSATKKMGELASLVREQSLQNDVRFVTISFDPEHDTPEVLAQYAKGFSIDLSNYSFLTGDAQTVNRLTKTFGVATVSENGTINHTMKTVIFNKMGNMVYATSQVDWKPKALLAIIMKNLKV